MPYPNFHAARMKDPGAFDHFANKEIADGIQAIIGFFKEKDKGSEVQAYRFDKTKFTAKEAEAWLKEHKFSPISFEPAKKEDEKPMKTNQLQTLATKIKPQVRREQLEGKEHLVVPMVMMTEGVHAGSNGPLYYPADELSKVPQVWNHKPIVVYHPTMNGQSVSACDPLVLNSRKVGIILNTTFQDGKLKAEAWLDASRINTVDDRISKSLLANEMMEVSTGLFTDTEEPEGVWNGEKYVGTAKNYKPDHLAILPDQKGACSIADGAGLLRNQESFDAIRQKLGALIPDDKSLGGIKSCWVQETYPDHFIYDKAGKLFSQKYHMDGDNPVLDGTAVEVERKTEYVPVANGGAGSGNFGHAGRPGEQGGSAGGEGGASKGDQKKESLSEKKGTVPTLKGDGSKLSIGKAKTYLRARGIELKPLPFDLKKQESRYSVTDSKGDKKEMSGAQIKEFLKTEKTSLYDEESPKTNTQMKGTAMQIITLSEMKKLSPETAKMMFERGLDRIKVTNAAFRQMLVNGGGGSGNFGHAGRPGEVGGSSGGSVIANDSKKEQK